MIDNFLCRCTCTKLSEIPAMYLSENTSNTTLYEKQTPNACNHAKKHYNKVRIPNLRSICQKKLIKWHYHSANTSENQITVANTNSCSSPCCLEQTTYQYALKLVTRYLYILNLKHTEYCCNPITFSTPANTFCWQYTCTHTHSLTHAHTAPILVLHTHISTKLVFLP